MDVRVGCHRALLNRYFSHLALVSFDQGGTDFLREMEIIGHSAETVESVVQVDGHRADGAHRDVAHFEQG